MTEKDPKKIKRYFILGFDLQQPSLNQHIGMCIFGHEEDSIRQTIRGDFVETIRIEEFEKLKEQNKIMREALGRNVEVIGGFLDILSIEGASNPDLGTAHRGMLEVMHCFERSRKALKQIEEDE